MLLQVLITYKCGWGSSKEPVHGVLSASFLCLPSTMGLCDQLIPLERAITLKTELFLSDKLMKNFGHINFITFGF